MLESRRKGFQATWPVLTSGLEGAESWQIVQSRSHRSTGLAEQSHSHEVARVAPGYNTPLCMWAPCPTSSPAGGTAEDAAGRCRAACPEAMWGAAGQLVRFTYPPNPSRIPRQKAVL